MLGVVESKVITWRAERHRIGAPRLNGQKSGVKKECTAGKEMGH